MKPSVPNGPPHVVLGGGIGSGKSLVAALLDAAGAAAETWGVLEPHEMVSLSMWMSVATYTPRGEVSSDEAPEPETFLLMGSGLLGLALLGQRRRARTKR